MAPPTPALPDEKGSSKPPVAADRDEIMNRVSLALAKQSRILDSLVKGRSNALSKPAAGSAGGGFSAFSTGGSAPATQASGRETAARLAADEAAFKSARTLPPNAGVGFDAAAGSVAERTREKELANRLLRHKLRIKGSAKGTGQDEDRRKRTAGNGDEESDEEDMGRSAVGRTKRVKVETHRGTSGKVMGKAASNVAKTHHGREAVQVEDDIRAVNDDEHVADERTSEARPKESVEQSLEASPGRNGSKKKEKKNGKNKKKMARAEEA